MSERATCHVLIATAAALQLGLVLAPVLLASLQVHPVAWQILLVAFPVLPLVPAIAGVSRASRLRREDPDGEDAPSGRAIRLGKLVIGLHVGIVLFAVLDLSSVARLIFLLNNG